VRFQFDRQGAELSGEAAFHRPENCSSRNHRAAAMLHSALGWLVAANRNDTSAWIWGFIAFRAANQQTGI
jgi:hypothetical protein